MGRTIVFLSSAVIAAREGRPQTTMACPTLLFCNVQLFRGHITSDILRSVKQNARQPASVDAMFTIGV
jgi:hypothetical protein